VTSTRPATPAWRLSFDADRGQLHAHDARGTRIWTLVAGGLRGADGDWSLGTFRDFRKRTLTLALPGDRTLNLTIHSDAHGARIDVDGAAHGAHWLRLDWRARDDEHYLGFGERFDTVDQRGRQIDLRVINGASRDVVYKPIPFVMSSAGFAVHRIGDLRSIVRLATPDEPRLLSWRAQGNRMQVRLYAGPDYKTMLSRYTAVVGRPRTPPEWVFGPWKSRDWNVEDQATVLDDLRKQRELGLPASVKLIDAMWERETHDFAFDPEKYPDLSGMVREAHDLGYRIVLWVAPFMVSGREPGPAYREAATRGYLIKREDGSPYVHRLGNSPTYLGTCIDFTNPAAVAWWQDRIRALVRLGISGFKTDFGEQVPDDARFFDGRRGFEMRNIFPRLYNRATYEAMQAETDGVLLGRSAWDGSQAISAIWAGDQTSDFAPETGLPSVIVAGQTAGLSGFPYWTSDIGGYFGTPTDDAFRRWTQFSAFSPLMQVHGLGPREPWLFAPETLEVYRKYARLHLDLFPYRYRYAQEASETGWPMMRALPFEFPDDPLAWGDTAETQFCLGRELMVAPASFGGERARQVVLPGGVAAWFDFDTGERFTPGTTVTVPCPPDRIPVFARAGAIIPLFANRPDTVIAANDPRVTTPSADLIVRLYPGADGEFHLSDGTHFHYRDAEGSLDVSGSPVARNLEVRRYAPTGITNHPLNLAANATARLRWDPNR